ncbi:MAG: divergent polysaccharide deacetylase family protein [Pontiellaceae bacterium]|nr:divergent polysaccharide deacetylase family protein [Pontiellaceae bacterium]MBN2786050.1 divergent polysaccharide deacetylase family protein [Pontiellaceae bacterium]
MRFLIVSLIALTALFGCRSPEPVRGPVVRHKQLFVVIDDAGLAMSETQQYLDIPVAMTIAVLPHLKDTEAVCKAIQNDPNKEIILHQPMEAKDVEKDPGRGAIRSMTPPEQVARIIDWNLSSVKGAVGMNNHMGSGITEKPQLMQAVLRHCRERSLFFLDSKTAYNSVVPRVAAKAGMHVEQRDAFLDIQHDREYVRRMWGQSVAKARENGYAVIIGHAWSEETAAAIRDSYETLLNQGYTFHLLSELYE